MGRKKVGTEFGEIVNPFGDAWEVAWTDGETEMIRAPTKNLALSLQPKQPLLVDNDLLTCSHYDTSGCHLSQDIDSPAPTKRTRSNTTKEPATKRTKKKTLKTSKSSKQSSKQSCKTRNTKEPATKRAKKKTLKTSKSSKQSSKQSCKTSNTKDCEEKNWRRCRAKKLSNTQRNVASKAFAAAKLDVSFIFAERSLQEYADMQKSPLHVNARNVFAAAIGQVMCQVDPPEERPLGGSVTKVFEVLFPICQQVKIIVSIDMFIVVSNDISILVSNGFVRSPSLLTMVSISLLVMFDQVFNRC